MQRSWKRALRITAVPVALACAWLLWFLYWAPLPDCIRNPPPLTSVFLDVKGRCIAELAGPEARSHRPIPLAEMGPWLAPATIALEDQRYYRHTGVDWLATARAVLRRHGGGSTITQQFVKIATGRTGRSVLSKVREMLMAMQLERHWSKGQILEAYLNSVPYSNRLIGVEAASGAYFNKPASALTQPEAIFLAGLPREPSRLNPWSHPDAAARQFEFSKKLLVARGVLAAREGASMALPVVGRHLPVNLAQHFVAAAGKHARRGVILCTLDLDLQRRAEQLVSEQLAALHRADISDAAMVIIENRSGAVRALVGSHDFRENQVDCALAYRNSGSTLKPFLYVTGIDRGILTAATLLPDTAEAARDAYRDYDPHNFVLSHLGPVRVREALGNSLNVPAVVAVNRIGAREAFNAIAAWGIKFDRPLEKAGAGFILGNVGVRLLDLTNAFAALARGGLAAPPRLLESDPMPLRRVVSADADEIVTDILCDNSARLQSFGPHSVLAFPVRVAAKTGTSAGFRDAWSEGFTREHTVGVWMGNLDGRPMDQEASIASAAPLWRRMMDDLLQTDHPVPEPKLPRTPICALTGLRPCKASPGVVRELFLPGTQPVQSAAAWFDPDGHPRLPAEYAGWCASADNFLKATVPATIESLAILFPRDGAVFLLDDNIPASQQRLEFQLSQPGAVKWTINGAEVVPDRDGRVLWPLAVGDWTVEASIASVRLSGRFSVRRP